MVAAIVREVGSQKSALPSYHVTIAASGLSKEQGFASRRVARNPSRGALASRPAHIGHDRAHFVRLEQQTKRRHPRAGDTVSNDGEKRAVREPAHLRARDDVGPVLAAAPVQSVTGRAARPESLAALRRRLSCDGCWSGAARLGPTRTQEPEKNQC